MTDTTVTPQPDESLDLAANNLDAAIERGDAPEPARSANPVAEPSLSDLEKMSGAELDKMLMEGTKAVEAPAAAAPVGDIPAAGGAAPTDEDGLPADPNGTVPIARLNQEIQKRRKLEQEREQLLQDRAYMAGKADAAASATAEPPVDHEAVIAFNLQKLAENYNDNIVKLAKQFDDGEFTAAEWKQREQQLEASFKKYQQKFTADLEEVRIRKNTPDPRTVAQDLENHAGLKAHSTKLEQDNPWLANIPKQLEGPMADAAVEVLAQHNIFLPKNPSFQELVEYTADLRSAMVDVARAWGFEKMAGTPASGTTTATQKADPEQIRSKLALARQQPPVTTIAGAALPTDAMSGIQPEHRTTDELAKLSPKELDALIERESRQGKAA